MLLIAVDKVAERQHGGARVRRGGFWRCAGLDALGERAGGLPRVGQSNLRPVSDGGLRELTGEPVKDGPGAPLGADAQCQASVGAVGVVTGSQGRNADRGKFYFHPSALLQIF